MRKSDALLAAPNRNTILVSNKKPAQVRAGFD
jgi:hypothetical protein